MKRPATPRPKRPDRGVVPVLAAVLLLGITTVIAGSVAAAQLGQGVPTPAPAVAWTIDPGDNETVAIVHGGGPTVDGSQLVVDGPGIDPGTTLAEVGPSRWSTGTAGTLTLSDRDNATVRLVWAPFGAEGLVVAEWRGSR